MNVKLVWATPDAERLIAYMARVSNPDNQDNPSIDGLLRYLAKNKHWSPFEMVNVCMEIECTRDIARQILRHRSFSFQEFSQRYAQSNDYEVSEVRLQDTKNRQNSLPTEDRELQRWWDEMQKSLIAQTKGVYAAALNNGIAKEVARKLLPEGLIMSRMYMNGTLRSWMHYVDIRCDEATQKEHRLVANKCKAVLKTQFPALFKD
jgi:thymidylate synthase (FAD)|tara:strand:- start:618 stop:1232 length:615 start_codon:yes stop_codon:yes gene_type:complete